MSPDSAADTPAPFSVAAADAPLRIAVVFYRSPFPMVRGDQLTVSHMIGFLSARGHEVDLFTLDLDGERTPDQAAWLDRHCNEVVWHQHPPRERLSGLVRGLATGLPAQVGYFDNAALRGSLASALGDTASSYDVVYVHTIRCAESLPEGCAAEGPLRFLAMQLSLELNARRIADRDRNPVKRFLYRWEASRLARYEASVWRRFDRVALIGEKDLEAVRDACARHEQPSIDNCSLIPHGTDVARFAPADPEEAEPGRIVFSGNMGYDPNVQAITWFVRHCWGEVRSAAPDARLLIVGKDPSPGVQRLERDPRITVTGTVPAVAPYIRSAAVCINPMQAAGGMQNKLIEYFACQKPVVATSVANEGINAPPSACTVVDDPADFATAVLALLQDRDRAQRLAAAAREYVEREWTWERHFYDLESLWFQALRDRS